MGSGMEDAVMRKDTMWASEGTGGHIRICSITVTFESLNVCYIYSFAYMRNL